MDLLSVSGHKINAPKGIGFLYVRKGTQISSVINGGGQEKRLRSGTENFIGAIAMAEAINHGTLSEQMTQHGLGTVIYGFINWTETNRGADTYRKPEYDITLHTIHNPIILQNEWKLEGEKYTDLGNFTFLSMNLNILLYCPFNSSISPLSFVTRR